MANPQINRKINYKSIFCSEIPPKFIDRDIAKKYFSQFGTLRRFILRPNRFNCTIEYVSEVDAARAFREAGTYEGCEFLVSYAEEEEVHVEKTENWVDTAEREYELDAMKPPSLHHPSSSSTTSFNGNAMLPPPPPPPQAVPIPPIATKLTTRAQKLPTSTPVSAPRTAKTEMARSELEALLRRPALTDEDKFRVLDARDKLIRMTTVRQTDIKAITKGSCPDMCPEKERYMREFQRQGFSFEMVDRQSCQIAHERAIKEYSRSSADQEVPLNHELRPEKVLQMTMSYILHRIIDLCNDPQTSVADWFHFVWDRLRSIRKDITQQELCSPASVELVEQCARFHIHCAARLVAEHSAVFDPKINAENLTKCLQTLKYMYHDLRLKNISSPCEAEFRSYVILLNLKDANFLWEVRQLPEAIQLSPQIKRAIAFYHALQNNNYVRFFNMIRSPETSYLSACILVGYFYKLRLRALEAIIKSHNWRKNSVLLPLDYLTRILGFENEESAANFFMYHGLDCEGGSIALDRIDMPDIEYKMDRAISLVESKLSTSVGECICGRPLEPPEIFENHRPHDSFYANGLLKPEAWSAGDQTIVCEEDAELEPPIPAQDQSRRPEERQFKMPERPAKREPSPAPPPMKDESDSSIFKAPPSAIKNLIPDNREREDKKTLNTTSIFGGNAFKTVPIISANDEDKMSFSFATSSPQTQQDTEPSSGNLFASPVFNAVAGPVASGGSIFGNTQPLGSSTPAATVLSPSGGIFGAAAKETADLFQQQKPSTPIFFSSRTKSPALDVASEDSFTPIAVGFPLTPDEETESESYAEDSLLTEETDAERLIRELNETQEENRRQLEEERRRLHELEEEHERLILEAKRERAIKKLNRQAQEMADRQLDTILMEEIREMATAVLTAYQQLEDRARFLTKALTDELLDEQVEIIVREEHAVMCRGQFILQRYFNLWRVKVLRKIEDRQLLETTPAWVTTDTRQQLADRVEHPQMRENLQMIKRYRLGAPCDFQALLWPGGEGTAEPKLNLIEIVANELAASQTHVGDGPLQVRKYFKLLLSVPDEVDELLGFESLCDQWLQKYVQRQTPGPNKPGEDALICAMEKEVALCVRKITGISPVNEIGVPVDEEWDHSNAIVFLMTASNLENTRERLGHLLHHAELRKKVPIAFIAYDCADEIEDELAKFLGLESLLLHGRICSYTIFGCGELKSQFSFPAHLYRAVRFVARSSCLVAASSRDLEMQPLNQWLLSNLGDEMWLRWHQSVGINPAFRKICSMPQHVVELFNEAVKRLCNMVTRDWSLAPGFPSELRQFVPEISREAKRSLPHFPENWRHDKKVQRLSQTMRKLQLPPVTTEKTQHLPINNVEQFQSWLIDYTARCLPHDESGATACAHTAICALVDQLNSEELQHLSMAERFDSLNLLLVMKPVAFAYAEHVLRHSWSQLPADVVYEREELRLYQLKPWWLHIAPVAAVTFEDQQLFENDFQRNNEDDGAVSAGHPLENQDYLCEVVLRAEKISQTIDEKMNQIRHPAVDLSPEASEMSRSLNASLYKFEVACQMGVYNVPTAGLSADECEQQEREDTSPRSRKRRHGGDDDVDARSDKEDDFGAIVARASQLIGKIEQREDMQRKLEMSELNGGILNIKV